jgi:alpha-L-rhamnosidase
MTIRKFFLLLFCFAAGGLPPLAARVTVTQLRCEYRVDPEGIGELHPRLGWILQAETGARGMRQTAY